MHIELTCVYDLLGKTFDAALNIGLVFDNTMVGESMVKVKNFAKRLVDSFTISDDAARFSLMFYGYRPSLDVLFKDGLNADELKMTIDDAKGQSGKAQIDTALQEAADRMFSAENSGGRSSQPKVLILFSSGSSVSDPARLNKAVEALRRAGVRIYIVMIGEGELGKMQGIAGREYVYSVRGYDYLLGVVNRLVTSAAQYTGGGCNVVFNILF